MKPKVYSRRGRLMIRWRITGTNKRPQFSLGLEDTPANRSEAEFICYQVARDLQHGVSIPDVIDRYSAKPSTKPVEALFEAFIDDQALEASTEAKYQSLLSRLRQYFKEEVVARNLTVDQCKEFIEFLKQYQKPSTVRDRILLLRKAWDWGNNRFDLYQNPWKAIDIPKRKKSEASVDPFTQEEMAKILETLKNHPTYGERYYKYVCFLNLSGFRLKEANELQWEDIREDYIVVRGSTSDIRKHSEQVGTGKSGIRHFPIYDQLRELLSTIERTSELVFTTVRGKPISTSSFTQSCWKKVLADAGVRYRQPKNIRYSFIAKVASKRLDISQSAYLMETTGCSIKLYERCYNTLDISKELPTVPDLYF